ncbi:MAG: glycosyltransferase [Methylobacter sp.]|jgi:hypothetical protein|nr:glycosyltransferase [Methylobacter sp.]
MAQEDRENRQDNPVKDIFFLNIEDAYSEAAKQNKIAAEQNGERLQYCYYDGPLTDIVLENFIQVPADDFVMFFSHNRLPIPQVIAISQDGEVHFNEMPADVIEEIKHYRSKYKIDESIHFDSYFIDPLLALNTAKQKNRVYCKHPVIDGLQLCYYRGELPEHDIENLVHIELHDFVDFFALSKLRQPERVEMPDEMEEELKLSVREDVANALSASNIKRGLLIQQLTEKAKAQKPVVVDGEPMRIAILSSRLSTVMQYCSRGVAKAFEKRGWQVLVHIEANDMELNNHIDRLSKIIDFNPHAAFCVNSLFNNFYHEDVVNIIWWQDPMPQIKTQELLNWRKNDFNFSISPFIDHYLKQCGAETVERQHFVIDGEVFYSEDNRQRQQKIIFVGTSYLTKIDFADDRQQQVIAQLVEILKRGGCFDQQTISNIAANSSFDYEYVFWTLLHYVVRDYSIKWLCQNATLPLDIYGRYWEQDPLVAPFFRGELPHGVEVADVYRSATYALVSHPFEINSQRLAEVAACGCIPVVYDCRDVAEPPHWDDYCLFFKTEDDLRNILENRLVPAKSPLLLAQHFTYDAAVEHFIEKSALKRLSSTAAVTEAASEEPVLAEVFGDNVVLHSRTANTIEVCRDRLIKNLAVLKNSRYELFDQLMAGMQGNKIDIVIDKLIGTEYWDLSLAINGENYYRLDNVALLENCQLIRDSATYFKRENTSCYALLSLGSGYELLEAFKQTERPIPEMEEFEVSIYVIEQEPGMLVLNMLLHDWEPIIASKRVQFFNHNAIGQLCEEWLKFQAALPTVLLDMKVQGGLRSEQLFELIDQAQQQRAQRHIANLHEIHEYYGAITDTVWQDKFKSENINSLRVMGFISRFSSFLKYCIRDLLDGFDRLGAVTTTCIEEENYYLANIEYFIEQLNSFKPDIILTINHFRHEFSGVPESIPFVNWIQDMLPHIRNNKTVMSGKDITFVFSKGGLGLNESPEYKNSPVEFLPVGYNDKIYFPIREEKNYDCDVLVITHLQEPEKTFEPIRKPGEFRLLLNENEMRLINEKVLTEAELIGLYRILDEHLSPLNIKEFSRFCTMRGGDTVDEFNAIFAEQGIALEQLVMDILYPFGGNRLHYEYLRKMKTWPVSLLLNAQPEINIRLFGKNWCGYPEFKKLNNGIADNGEYINKLMNNAKICLNVSPGITLHMRALEIMASCSFMLSRRNEYDRSPLTDYFSEEQVVLFDDEIDFINKVRLYLDNEQARNQVSQNALNRLQQVFSYKAVAESILSSVRIRLSK